MEEFNNIDNEDIISQNETANKDKDSKQDQYEQEPVQLNYNEQPVYPAKYTDSDNSEDEGMEDYKVGGYHPIHVG